MQDELFELIFWKNLVGYHKVANKLPPDPQKPPKVGVFWFSDNMDHFLCKSIPVTLAENYGGKFRGLAENHFEIWDEKDKPEEWQDKKWFEVPRGRVMFDYRTGNFKILLSKKQLGNTCLIDKLVQEFNLADAPYVVVECGEYRL